MPLGAAISSLRQSQPEQIPHGRQIPDNHLFASLSGRYEYEFSGIPLKTRRIYAFLIFDPNWNLLHVLHFKGFFANIFGDCAVGMNTSKKYFRWAGLELCVEIRLSRAEVPFITGAHGYFLLDRVHVYRMP